MADYIRQAQKSGANSITFTFADDGGVSFDVDTDNEFTVDTFVEVTPKKDDDFTKFTGHIEAFRGDFISVKDDDTGDIWDVKISQLKKLSE